MLTQEIARPLLYMGVCELLSDIFRIPASRRDGGKYDRIVNRVFRRYAWWIKRLSANQVFANWIGKHLAGTFLREPGWKRENSIARVCRYTSLGTILKILSSFIGSLQPSLSKFSCVKQIAGRGSLCELLERANRPVLTSWNNAKGSVFRIRVYRKYFI